jgi:predicted DNA-binding transcriptional regulator YafY
MSHIPANAPSESSIERQVVEIDYTNFRGKREIRRIVPIKMYFGRNKFHEADGEAWFLVAWAVDRRAYRTFNLKKIHEWKGRP